MIVTGARADASIYTCKKCPTNYKPQNGAHNAFTDPMWEKLATLELGEINQTVHLNPPNKARFVALARQGYINMAEVEIYQYTCE